MSYLPLRFLVDSVGVGGRRLVKDRVQHSASRRRTLISQDARTIVFRGDVLQNESVAVDMRARTHTARIFADRADLWTISAVSSKIRAMLELAARIFGRAADKPWARGASL